MSGPTFDIACRDALAFLAELEPSSVDAIITDPPYSSGAFTEAGRKSATRQGMNETAERLGWFESDQMGTAGLAFLLRGVGVQAARILRPGGWFLCFLDWRQVPNIAPAIESAGLLWRNLVVWDKGTAGFGLGFRAQHEMILAYTTGVPEKHDTRTGNVLHHPRVHHAGREHPTEKPLGLLLDLIEATTPIGGVVVDPFCGSGSCGEAALQLGRSFRGADREPSYAEGARARCNAAAKQESLFPLVEATG